MLPALPARATGVCSTSGRDAPLPQQAAGRLARSRRPAHAARQTQQHGNRPPLACSAAGEQNGAGPQLSEEEVKRMTDDFVKEIIEGAGANDPESKTYQIRGGLTAQQTVAAVGMGSWRLKGLMSPAFEKLEAHVEGMWREILGDDLSLFDLKPEHKYCDSLDPDKEFSEISYQEMRSPEPGEDGWPRMQLENRCYSSRVFRKLHMELLHRQDGFEVLHCVMFPRLEYDLPILGMDMVGAKGRVSLAVIDPSPAAMDRTLPPMYSQGIRQLQEQYRMTNNRTKPDWGEAIFSEHCVIMRPQGEAALADFIKYAIAVTRMHLQLARLAMPVQTNRARRMADIQAAHERYSAKQLENDKTRRVLEAGFGTDFAEGYLRDVLFDEGFAPAAAATAPEH